MREMKGHLSLLGLGTLLQTAAQAGTRGSLTVAHNSVSKTLFIDGPQVHLVMSTQRKTALLGQILLREEKIKLSDLQMMLTIAAKMGQRLGQLLIAHRLITADDLVAALVQQSMEEFFDLFSWDDGVFEFREEEPPAQEMMPAVPVMGLVLEAARRQDEHLKIRQILTSMKLVPVRVRRELPETDPGLNPLVVRSLSAYIDDRRNIGDILRLCPHPSFEIEFTLVGLARTGALKLHDPDKEFKTVALQMEEEQRALPVGHILVLSDLRTYGDMLATGLLRAGLSASAHDPDIEPMGLGMTRPDGVLLDISDSANLRERIETIARDLGAPVAVLAGNPTPQVILQLKEAGARDVILKPISVEQLVPKLRALFGLDRAHAARV